MSGPPSSLALLSAVSEPTRLRIVNCLAAAPLFVSDLQAILDLPQPTVSRHLQILRKVEVVRDTPIAPYVLYRLQRPIGPGARLLNAVLDAIREEGPLRAERSRALERSRTRLQERVPAVVFGEATMRAEVEDAGP